MFFLRFRRRKFDRHAKRWRYGNGILTEAMFSSGRKLLIMREKTAGRCEFHQFCSSELSVGALNVELAEFERLCNAYRPHQALGQAAPMRRIMKTSTKARLPPEQSHMH